MAGPAPGWWNGYVGTPFRWGGSARDGVSCWGLVCMVLDEVFGVTLPRESDVEHVVAKTSDGELAAAFKAHATTVPLGEERAGDLLQMWGVYQGRRVPLHVGIVTQPGQVLHVEQGTCAVVEDYRRSPRARWRVIGAWRV